MHLFVFSYNRRSGLSKYDYSEAIKKLDLAVIKRIAPSATLYEPTGGSSHEYAKICQATGNGFEHSIFVDVPDASEAQALLASKDLLVRNTKNYYWYSLILRYAYKDIDYDALAPQAIMELLGDQDAKANEKHQRSLRLKKVSKFKRDLETLSYRASMKGIELSETTYDLIGQVVKQVDEDHAAIKSETAIARKEADKNKSSLRAKLNKFVVYNAYSTKKA